MRRTLRLQLKFKFRLGTLPDVPINFDFAGPFLLPDCHLNRFVNIINMLLSFSSRQFCSLDWAVFSWLANIIFFIISLVLYIPFNIFYLREKSPHVQCQWLFFCLSSMPPSLLLHRYSSPSPVPSSPARTPSCSSFRSLLKQARVEASRSVAQRMQTLPRWNNQLYIRNQKCILDNSF